MKRLVFIDSGVLIAASRGTDEIAQKAFEIFNDPEIEYVSSLFVQLETLPKPFFFRRNSEVDFYNEFFGHVSVWVEPNTELVEAALGEASMYGLGAIDALHVVSAVQGGAVELVTTEKIEKPIHQVTSIPIRSIAA